MYRTNQASDEIRVFFRRRHRLTPNQTQCHWTVLAVGVSQKLTSHVQPGGSHGNTVAAVLPRLHVLDMVHVVYFVDVGVDDTKSIAVIVAQNHVVQNVMVEIKSEG